MDNIYNYTDAEIAEIYRHRKGFGIIEGLKFNKITQVCVSNYSGPIEFATRIYYPIEYAKVSNPHSLITIYPVTDKNGNFNLEWKYNIQRNY